MVLCGAKIGLSYNNQTTIPDNDDRPSLSAIDAHGAAFDATDPVFFYGRRFLDRWIFTKPRKGDRNALIFSPYTLHFSPSSEHQHVWLVGIERERENGLVAGAAFFTNSFGQPSLYYYPWGAVYRGLGGNPQLYAKLTAGLLYGYTGKYENKVPFNHSGFSPGIVPALGWDLGDGFEVQANMLGFAGLMVQLSLPLK